MSKQTIRPYEMSLWTLQDSFITVLKSPNISHKGHIQEPIFTLKTDGTQEITFSIPMYIFEGEELIENPLWYNVNNGTLIANLRKIKIIFNKGEKDLEKIYEFVIEKVTEIHQNGTLMCEVTGTGLAFQELGKTGYKISFGLDGFENDYTKWFEQENPKPEDEPVATLDYWVKKLVEGTNWTYEIQMDWSAYDGIADNSLRTSEDRQPNKVYEDDYVASWEATNNSLVPTRYETFREKARIVSVEKSNRYNISQTIAETFGVFCRYEYKYDDNYHIIGRKIIFYNTFLDERNSKIDIDYPYHTNSIKRELDSVDVTTKLYVTPISETSMPSGMITIADVNANRTYDDFILNFDYLYSIGTISEEQYQHVTEYETKLYILNQELNPALNKINEINLSLPELRAKLLLAQDGQKLAEEEIRKAQEMMQAIVGNDGILERTTGNPVPVVLLKDGRLNTYYINIPQEGVLSSSIKVYKKYSNGKVEELETSYTIKKDEYGNVDSLTGFLAPENDELKFRYLVYQYRPRLQYENIIIHYNQVMKNKMAEEADLLSQIAKLEEDLNKWQLIIDTKLEEKEKLNSNFEKIMGSALREGSWQADEYKNYGDKGQESIYNIGNEDSNGLNKIVKSIWDVNAFDGEQLSYYESGINQQRINYYVLDINSKVPALVANGLEKIFLIQKGQTDSIYNKKLGAGSDMQYGFFQNNETKEVIAGLIITDQTFNSADGDYYLAVLNITDENGVLLEQIASIEGTNNLSPISLNQYTQVYPRIYINSNLAQTFDGSLIVKNAVNTKLKKYEDYSVILQNLIPYITLKPHIVLANTTSQQTNGINGGYTVSYSLSNASLALYLDALEVSRDNAYPKASYEVELNVFKPDFLKTAYSLLGKIVHINDFELHFENVQGYISELVLNLDRPWEDKFVTQNYKTKFEDLFSRIVASSEQMKTNALVYDLAASAFDSNGALKKENIQLSLNQSDLNYSFANGTLTINEQEGIWGISDSGVVAFRGGGIFTANKKDAVGNWIWNSGITPNGINAALLTAGQIDTNLIKVYAGDNVRFQLNADGLFAYRSNADGTSNANNYVVHNAEGLFLTDSYIRDENALLYNKVEVSWDGLIIRDSNHIKEEQKDEQGNIIQEADDGKVFYADDKGNLNLRGYIYTEGGEIGGWGLDKTSLFSLGNTVDENSNIVKGIKGGVGMASAARINEDLTIDNHTINDDGTYIVFWAGRNHDKINTDTNLYDDKFQVLSDGTLKASDVVIEGIIKATTGNIGKWEIGENGISSSNNNFITGITATEQSIYYDNFYLTNTDMINFLNITDAGKDSSGNYSLSEAIRVSVGTQPVFYSGIKEPNRLGLYNNNGEWKVFEAGNTYTYSVLADGLVYAKNLALDGSLFVSNTISFLDIENKLVDRHIFSVKENTSLSIIDPAHGVSEQVFFGVEKVSKGYTPYNFAISHKGNVSIADGEIFIGTSGLFITSRKDGLPYRLASGFNTNVSDQDSTPFLWAASFLETNSLKDISLDNTAFYISGTGTTFAKNIYTEQIKGDTFITSSLRLIKNTKDTTIRRLIIDDNESYIDNNGNIVFNPLFTKDLWITGNPENKENGLLISYNSETQEAIFSGLNSGSNTFNLSSTGIGNFIRLEADEFRTSRFTTEEIGTINGSMLISNNLRYLSYTRAANEITFTTEEAITNVNKYDLIDIEFHNNPCRMVVTEIGEDQKTIVGYLLSNPPSDIPSQGLLFIIGVLKLLVRIKTIEENTITLTTEINENIDNSFVQEMLEKYISIYNQFTLDGYSINGTIQKVNDDSSDWLFFANNDDSIPMIDEIVYLQSAQGSQSYSRIYLRALDETPEIIFYRSLHLEDNPNVNHYAPATHLNKSSLVLKIGNLEDIIDPDFSEISLSGSGLYGENVYLKGSLVLPSAGITNDSSVSFNYSEWISENSNKASLNENDTSPIRFWAGAPGVNRKKAPLVITENGSLYATQGVFQGQIIATNGIFSGYITSTGVILDSSTSNFYFAKSPTNGEEITLNDYIIDVTADNGLEIYDDGFCVFSGIERPLEGDIYLDYSNNSNTGFKYQFPYVSAKQDEKTLIAYNINTLQFEANIGSEDTAPATFFGMKQTANSFEWYGAITPLTLQGNDATNAWRDYYEQALSPTKQQSYYAIKVNNSEFNLGPELEDLQFTFSNNNLKFNTGNCVIESVNGGINIRVLDEN